MIDSEAGVFVTARSFFRSRAFVAVPLIFLGCAIEDLGAWITAKAIRMERRS